VGEVGAHPEPHPIRAMTMAALSDPDAARLHQDGLPSRHWYVRHRGGRRARRPDGGRRVHPAGSCDGPGPGGRSAVDATSLWGS
jgi:hypothetical protein